MAKRYSLQEKKAMQKKKEQAQAQKEREMVMKLRKPLLIGLAAVAAIALIWWVAVTFICPPANSVSVIGGKTIGVEDSWLVANLGTSSKPKYYHMASVTAPEGYTLDADYTINSDTNVRTLYYLANDESAPVKSLFYTGVANGEAQTTAERVADSGYFIEKTGPKSIYIGSYDVVYTYGTMQSYDNDGNALENEGTASMYAYINGIQNSSVCVVLSTRQGKLDELPSADVLEAQLESALSVLTMSK